MPKLIEFYEQNADLKDSFEFISIHNKHELAKDFETLDKAMLDRKIVETRWGGKTMTWPMMIDGEAKTARTWGISGYPTMAIVDPEGKLHSWGHHHVEAFAKVMADVRAKKAGASDTKPEAPAAPAKAAEPAKPTEPAKAAK